MQRHLTKVLVLSLATLGFSSAFAFRVSYGEGNTGYYQDEGYGTNYAYQDDDNQYSRKSYKKRGSGGGSFPSSRPATGNTVFIYDPKITTWAVYSPSGELIRTGHGSGGQHYCRDVGRGCHTPAGVFSIQSKQGPGYRSKKFPLPHGGAPMPYAMFFTKGFAIHGASSVPNYNASHGCIRVYPGDARWLSNNILNVGSTVIVRSY
jgi:hypothetical protein